MTNLARQGDILLRRISRMPANVTEVRDNVLARGEVTGHSHRIVGAKVFRNGNQQLLVEVPEAATLVHEEHAPISLDAGIYEVVRQREYDPLAERTVSD
jgi:hypothetical protein